MFTSGSCIVEVVNSSLVFTEKSLTEQYPFSFIAFLTIFISKPKPTASCQSIVLVCLLSSETGVCLLLIPLDKTVLFRLKKDAPAAQVEQFITESKEGGRKIPGKATN